MKKIITYSFILLTTLSLNSCGIYNFTGGDVGTAKTFQVNLFQNYATQTPGSTFEPGLDRSFTNELQDYIQSLTTLNLTSNDGDLLYEGEITEFRITPMTATSDQTAAQNRLTMSVNVRFYNKTKEDVDFDQKFSFYYDYGATESYASIKTTALEEIIDRISQDIFNASLADW